MIREKAGTTLVTGGAGFAGSHALDMLTETGQGVVAWHRPGATPADARARWFPVDLTDRVAVGRAIDALRPSLVYHCAGAAHVGRAWTTSTAALEINVLGTHHLLEAIRRADLRATVLIPSSAMVYQPSAEPIGEDSPLVPVSPYGTSKLAQERLGFHAVADGLDVRLARAFNHIGPRQDHAFAAAGFARRIADIEAGLWPEPVISVGNLQSCREVTDVRDTVRAYRRIMEAGHPGRPYNVCSGHAVAIGDILDRLLRRARVAIRVQVDERRLRPNDIPMVVGNPTRIREDLGWTPTIPIDQTLDDLLEYWRQRAR